MCHASGQVQMIVGGGGVEGEASSSVGPVANATDVLQPSRLIVLTLSPPPVWTFPRLPFAARYPHVHNDARES